MQTKVNFKIVIVFLILFSCFIRVFSYSQTEWIKYEGNPVLTGGGSGSWNEMVTMPYVLFDGTTYHLWYTGFDANGYPGIGYASSSDGITWTDYAQNPVLVPGESNSWDGSVIETHCVILDGATFKMWYTAYNNNITDIHASIGYATSPDGVNWQKYEGNPVMSPATQTWEGIAVGGAQVVKIESTYHLWYVGSFDYDIGYATSQDGITWNRYQGNPIMKSDGYLWPCKVVFHNSIYKMWYNQGPLSNVTINLAVSTDGVNWTPSAVNPVLERGDQGAWDEASIGTCSIIFSDSTYKMWYEGGDNIGNYGIGYATSTTKAHDIAITSVFDSLNILPIFCNANFVPKLTAMNIGLSDEFNVMVNCIIDSTGHEIYKDSQTIDTLRSNILEWREVIFSPCHFKTFESANYNLKYFVMHSGDQNMKNDTLEIIIQISNIIDDFETGNFKWSPDSFWVVSFASPYNGKACLRNTDQTMYENGVDSWIEFKYSFDLSQLNKAYLSYYTKHFIENGKDFGYVEASSDGGQTWKQLGDAYTGALGNWTVDFRSLNDFCGPGFEDVRLRFHFVSDTVQGYPALGWYIDDIAIHSGEVSVHNLSQDHTPQSYRLFDNYPNPFNAQTVIRFQLPKAGLVKLSVYNLLGQEIRTLTNNHYQAGDYQLSWNGKNNLGNSVPSGIYFYRWETNRLVATKKMSLLK